MSEQQTEPEIWQSNPELRTECVLQHRRGWVLTPTNTYENIYYFDAFHLKSVRRVRCIFNAFNQVYLVLEVYTCW